MKNHHIITSSNHHIIKSSNHLIKIILFSLLLSPFFLSAQISHEVSVSGGGGLSTLTYKLSSGKKTPGFGGEVGLEYTCHFLSFVGLTTGLDVGFYNAKAKLNGVKVITHHLTDNEGDRFNMHTTLNSYKESQNAIILSIPLMVHFQAGATHKFYARGGFKFGFPIKSEYKVSNATLTNEGYYPDYENGLKEPAFAGYGTFNNINAKGKLPLKVSVALALEAGVKWDLGSVVALYLGAYFDYSLNNIAKNKPFVNYNAQKPAEFTTNSAIPALSSKMNLMAAGLKLRIGFVKQ